MTVHKYATIEQQLARTYGPHTRTTQLMHRIFSRKSNICCHRYDNYERYRWPAFGFHQIYLLIYISFIHCE